MKARLIYRNKVITKNRMTELVIWELPHKTPDRPHRLKCRLYHGDRMGRCLVRYDNELGKGDHKHIGIEEVSYTFISVEKLVADFMFDIEQLS